MSVLLTLDQVRHLLTAAKAKAVQTGKPFSMAVLDAGGALLAFERMDGVHLGTIEVAQAKARCAILFRRPTREFQRDMDNGKNGLLALPGVVPFAGGIPVMMDGYLAGAIGVSGASPDTDDAVALAGMQAIINGEPT